jgi:hypothetical protein
VGLLAPTALSELDNPRSGEGSEAVVAVDEPGVRTTFSCPPSVLVQC